MNIVYIAYMKWSKLYSIIIVSVLRYSCPQAVLIHYLIINSACTSDDSMGTAIKLFNQLDN